MFTDNSVERKTLQVYCSGKRNDLRFDWHEAHPSPNKKSFRLESDDYDFVLASAEWAVIKETSDIIGVARYKLSPLVNSFSRPMT